MNGEQRKKLHKMVLEFAMYSRINIPRQIANARAVLRGFPKDIRNEPLCWLLNNSVKGALEGLLNDLAQALDLVKKTTNDLGESVEITTEMADAKRMRDTLLAHRMEVLVSTDQHHQWYKQKYGSFEKAFELVEIVSSQIGDLASQLSQHMKFERSHVSMAEPVLVKKDDITSMLEALKSADAY